MRTPAKYIIMHEIVREMLVEYFDCAIDIDISHPVPGQTQFDVQVLDIENTLWSTATTHTLKTAYIDSCPPDYLYKLGVNTAYQLIHKYEDSQMER